MILLCTTRRETNRCESRRQIRPMGTARHHLGRYWVGALMHLLTGFTEREREWNVPIIVYNIRHLWSKKGIDNCFERNTSPLLLIIITFIFRRGRSEQQSARLRRDYTAVHIFYKYTGPLFRRRLDEDGWVIRVGGLRDDPSHWNVTVRPIFKVTLSSSY